jgi:hypothetical protein
MIQHKGMSENQQQHRHSQRNNAQCEVLAFYTPIIIQE